jgi:phage terminase small subunit
MVKRVQLKKGENHLDAKQKAFVHEYLRNGRSPTRAAEAAGYKYKNRNVLTVTAQEVFNRPAVRALIDQETEKRLDRLQITGDDVAKYWWNLATADARELSPIVRACCRYCYGIDHHYQFTLPELRRARVTHLVAQQKLPKNERKPFDEQGGDGYDRTKEPNQDCPQCRGQGQWISRPINLDNLSEGAALLFDGIKTDRHGNIEIKLRDRSRALEMFGWLTGLGPKPGTQFNFAQINQIDIGKLTDEQLDQLLSRLMLSMSHDERAPYSAALRDPLDNLTDVTPVAGDSDL